MRRHHHQDFSVRVPPSYLKLVRQNSEKVKALTTMQLNDMLVPYKLSHIPYACLFYLVLTATIVKAIRLELYNPS